MPSQRHAERAGIPRVGLCGGAIRGGGLQWLAVGCVDTQGEQVVSGKPGPALSTAYTRCGANMHSGAWFPILTATDPIPPFWPTTSASTQ